MYLMYSCTYAKAGVGVGIRYNNDSNGMFIPLNGMNTPLLGDKRNE